MAQTLAENRRRVEDIDPQQNLTHTRHTQNSEKNLNRLFAFIAIGCFLPLSNSFLAAQDASALRDQAKQQTTQEREWTPLFDGESMKGWRDFRGKKINAESWQVEDGTLMSLGKPGNIVTEAEFEHFELKFEWKVGEAANSGIFYRVDEEVEVLHESGLEYQVLDNIGQAGRPETEQAGACYGVIGPEKDLTRSAGEWNTGRIVVAKDHVQHYLNGQLIVEYTIGSDDYTKRVQAGPLRNHPKLAKTARGRICLQNYHGHRAWFRNLFVRELNVDN